MFRKIALTGLAVVAGLFILRSTHLGAYTRTAWGKIRNTAKAQVPLEFQLDMLKNEAAHLIPDMRNNVEAIATEMVAVDNLRNEVADLRSNFDKQKALVRVLNDELKSGNAVVNFNGHRYSADRVRNKLARELATCKRMDEELKAKEDLLEAREKGLSSAKDQLAGMRSQKEQIDVQIAQLEAELKTLRVAQTRSNFSFDDSRLSQIKESLRDIRNQLKTKQKALELGGKYFDEDAPAADVVPTAAQLTKEADAYLGGTSSDETVARTSKR